MEILIVDSTTGNVDIRDHSSIESYFLGARFSNYVIIFNPTGKQAHTFKMDKDRHYFVNLLQKDVNDWVYDLYLLYGDTSD